MRHTCYLEIREMSFGGGFNNSPQAIGVYFILKLPKGVSG